MKAFPASADSPSNYRARLFWLWQAWRLRKRVANEAAGSTTSVFANYAALDRRGHADAIVELVASLSRNTADLTAASAADVRRRLQRELSARACAVVLSPGKGAIGGYAWGSVGDGAATLAVLRESPNLARLGPEAWQTLDAQVADAATLVVHDIGLDARYRYGFAPLKQLVKPLFDLGVSHGARRALWWAPRTNPLYGLSLAFGARCIDVGGDIVFFVHHDLGAIARVLGALPAGEISSLLARVGPARRPRARIAALPEDVARRLAVDVRHDAQGTEPAKATYADYAAAIAATRYPGLDVAAGAANDPIVVDAAVGAAALDGMTQRDGDASAGADAAAAHAAMAGSVVNGSGVRLADQHPPLLALPQRLSALFPRAGRSATA